MPVRDSNCGAVAQLVYTKGCIEAVRRYVTLEDNGSYSFHRYYAAITSVSLQPSNAAFGYKATFHGDEMVQNAVKSFGYHLGIKDGNSKTAAISGEEFTDGRLLTLRLRNILSDDAYLSSIGASAIICADVFVEFSNGQTSVSNGCEYTLRTFLETINANTSAYTDTQMQAVKDMCQTYAVYMEGWEIDNILNWPVVPMDYPDYTFDTTPTTVQLRKTAVKAMADMLNVKWSVDQTYSYTKESTNAGTYTYHPGVNYAGIPYTQADGSLIQWYEFYDETSGKLVLPEGGDMNTLVGNTCAGAIGAAWATVCDSIYGNCSTATMVPQYGFIPVGSYTFDDSLASYLDYSTNQICADNGQEVMYRSYAMVQKADALVSTSEMHAMMAIQDAVVAYNTDGTIDPENSYIMIQDQRAGMISGGYEVTIGDKTVYYSGRTSAKYTFSELWKKGWIPLTTAEFMGTDAYCAPTVTATETHIQSNYPICIAKLVLVDSVGNETVVQRILLNKNDIKTGVARNLALSMFDLSAAEKLMESGRSYTIEYRVTVSNGQVFIPITNSVTAQ